MYGLTALSGSQLMQINFSLSFNSKTYKVCLLKVNYPTHKSHLILIISQNLSPHYSVGFLFSFRAVQSPINLFHDTPTYVMLIYELPRTVFWLTKTIRSVLYEQQLLIPLLNP